MDGSGRLREGTKPSPEQVHQKQMLHSFSLQAQECKHGGETSNEPSIPRRKRQLESEQGRSEQMELEQLQRVEVDLRESNRLLHSKLVLLRSLAEQTRSKPDDLQDRLELQNLRIFRATMQQLLRDVDSNMGTSLSPSTSR